MNKTVLIGRLTRDPELRQTQSGISVVKFTLAVDRRFKSQSGEREADFVSCVACGADEFSLESENNAIEMWNANNKEKKDDD